jgi:hypothetical protein
MNGKKREEIEIEKAQFVILTPLTSERHLKIMLSKSSLFLNWFKISELKWG